MLKTLHKIDYFLQNQTDSNYILYAFAWYFVFIPFRFIYEPVNCIWGHGKRRRKEIKDAQLYNQANIELMKKITESKAGLSKEDLKLFLEENKFETKFFDENLQYLITWNYASFNEKTELYQNTNKSYKSLEKKFSYSTETKKWAKRKRK